MKRNYFYLICILLIMTAATGCKEKDMGTPAASTVADFSYAISNQGYAPCEVTFTNASLNALSYSWDFGNGQTSTETNPVANYTTPGLYTVKLTCAPVNSVYYNQAVKTMVVNVKDPLAGLSQVLYFTTRGNPGNGHMVILDDAPPLQQDFVATDLSRPYGIAVDTAHKKVYITDFSNQAIYRYNADGTNPEKILDATVPGQELVGDAEAIFVLGDKIYWGRTGGIYRANLDGSNPEEFIAMHGGDNEPEFPIDMQYDPSTNKIYLVNDKTDYLGGFWSVNFDGTNFTKITFDATGTSDVDGTAMEIDFRSGKAYLVLYGSDGTVAPENGVFMCNLDGTGFTKIGDYGLKATWGITLDETHNKLFWGVKNSNSNPDGKIIRANLDGSNPEDWITNVSPHAMTVVWIKL
ncbi:MAG: PKD domain-containing protein [Bacteroidales bacterium]|nr:PKD domain-containing protein [Bacteroidales bacterium]